MCQNLDVIMYTDCNVLFMNITASLLEEAKDLVSVHNGNTECISYEPQQKKRKEAWALGTPWLCFSLHPSLPCS